MKLSLLATGAKVMAVVSLWASACSADLIGLWEFGDSSDLGKATVGANLSVEGQAPDWLASQTFNGLTLNGTINTKVGQTNGLLVQGSMLSGNGGGSRVNEYSLVFDVRRPAGDLWRSFFQTDSDRTANDADYFVRNTDKRLGVGNVNYSDFAMGEDEWYRLVVTVKTNATVGQREMFTYLTDSNGTMLTHQHNAGASGLAIDGRMSLDTNGFWLFADEDFENNPLTLGMVALFDNALTAQQVQAFGIAGSAIPEPTSWAVLGLATIMVGLRRRGRV